MSTASVSNRILSYAILVFIFGLGVAALALPFQFIQEAYFPSASSVDIPLYPFLMIWFGLTALLSAPVIYTNEQRVKESASNGSSPLGTVKMALWVPIGVAPMIVMLVGVLSMAMSNPGDETAGKIGTTLVFVGLGLLLVWFVLVMRSIWKKVGKKKENN